MLSYLVLLKTLSLFITFIASKFEHEGRRLSTCHSINACVCCLKAVYTKFEMYRNALLVLFKTVLFDLIISYLLSLKNLNAKAKRFVTR